jgi:RNA-directed DNA polymerase
VGIDGVSATRYSEHPDENLTSLLGRFKSGSYRAPPVRRVFIAKGDGNVRPIGIPTSDVRKANCSE